MASASLSFSKATAFKLELENVKKVSFLYRKNIETIRKNFILLKGKIDMSKFFKEIKTLGKFVHSFTCDIFVTKKINHLLKSFLNLSRLRVSFSKFLKLPDCMTFEKSIRNSLERPALVDIKPHKVDKSITI